MTTIVYRDGTLAGDGRETFIEEGESSVIARDDCVKVFRLPDGRLFGGSKTSEDIYVLHDALIKSCGWRGWFNRWPTPKLDDVNALCVDLDGKVYYYEGARWTLIEEGYASVGSGSRFAIPALDAGADAVTAVQIGVKRDPFSGGLITVLSLND